MSASNISASFLLLRILDRDALLKTNRGVLAGLMNAINRTTVRTSNTTLFLTGGHYNRRTKVCPWVERRTVSRDRFTVRTSGTASLWAYRDLANAQQFSSYLLSSLLVSDRDGCGVGRAVDCFVDAVS